MRAELLIQSIGLDPKGLGSPPLKDRRALASIRP